MMIQKSDGDNLYQGFSSSNGLKSVEATLNFDL
jgi:hypothetical protein